MHLTAGEGAGGKLLASQIRVGIKPLKAQNFLRLKLLEVITHGSHALGAKSRGLPPFAGAALAIGKSWPWPRGHGRGRFAGALGEAQGRLPHSTQTPSGPMMPMQLSSEQSLRPVFDFATTRFWARSLPQWGQNLAQRGAGLWHCSQASLGMAAPHSSQLSSMTISILSCFPGVRPEGANRNPDMRRISIRAGFYHATGVNFSKQARAARHRNGPRLLAEMGRVRKRS